MEMETTNKNDDENNNAEGKDETKYRNNNENIKPPI